MELSQEEFDCLKMNLHHAILKAGRLQEIYKKVTGYPYVVKEDLPIPKQLCETCPNGTGKNES